MGNEYNPIINIEDVKLGEFGNGSKFAAKLGPIGASIGLEKLGCMLTVVEPGKSAFPFHVHHNNDELFYILEGEGNYRFGEDNYDIKTGDILAAPAGGPEFSHQIVNTGNSTLKYIALSTKMYPEVVEYPDSEKFGVFSRSEDGSPMNAKFRHIGRQKNTYDYWDGEE